MLKALCIWLRLCSDLSGGAFALDGDTLVITGVHVRLQGIDAEELNEPHGRIAKSSLQQLINPGITCNLTGEYSYNRMVGTCYTKDGLDVGGEMVRLGHALDCPHYSNGKYKPLEPEGIHTKLIQKPYC